MRTALQIRILLPLLSVMIDGQSVKQDQEDPAWTIAGDVTADSGTLSAVRIWSEGPERPAEVSTDASGHYTFSRATNRDTI